METKELEKLKKAQLIEVIKEYEEKLKVMRERDHILRLDIQ